MAETDPRLLLLHRDDNVFVLRDTISASEKILVEGQTIEVPLTIGMGHKLARRTIQPGDKVVKYGAPIGSATANIEQGDHVHLSNLKSDYTATYSLADARNTHEAVARDDKL